jgi:hypothetical protein
MKLLVAVMTVLLILVTGLALFSTPTGMPLAGS